MQGESWLGIHPMESRGWALTPWKEHGSALPALGWQCYGAFDLVGASHLPHLCTQCVLEVAIPRRARWFEVAGGGNGRFSTSWPHSILHLSPTIIYQTRCTPAAPSFQSKQGMDNCHKCHLCTPILIPDQFHVLYFSEPISTTNIPK